MKVGKRTEKLISDYLRRLSEREKLELSIEKLKGKIIDESLKLKVKRFSYQDSTLFVSQKEETVFPGVGAAGREKVERILRDSGKIGQVLSFDIVKLGNAYDAKKLPLEVLVKLKPYARKTKMERIIVKKAV